MLSHLANSQVVEPIMLKTESRMQLRVKDTARDRKMKTLGKIS
jgi:hypothetical protein